MKKFAVFFTLICMLSLLAVSAFADEAALKTSKHRGNNQTASS